MLFGTSRVEAEWRSGKLSPITVKIVEDAQAYALDRWAWTFLLTCIWRSVTEDTQLEGSGIHTAWRAVDVRDKDQNPDAIADVTAYVNGKYVYDPTRPQLVVCYSRPHGSGPHCHLQAHSRTVLASAFPG